MQQELPPEHVSASLQLCFICSSIPVPWSGIALRCRLVEEMHFMQATLFCILSILMSPGLSVVSRPYFTLIVHKEHYTGHNLFSQGVGWYMLQFFWLIISFLNYLSVIKVYSVSGIHVLLTWGWKWCAFAPWFNEEEIWFLLT